MPNVHGVEFNANQSKLVIGLVRELLKDGKLRYLSGTGYATAWRVADGFHATHSEQETAGRCLC